ncbi:MAG: hypothetical protein WCG21_13940 [Eubacteriales bacterium]
MIINQKQNRYRLAAAGFVAFAFLVYFAWAFIQPFNSAPDEYMRYQISQFIYRKGFLPLGSDPEIINPIWGTSYGFTPILAYIIGAAFMKITSLVTTNSFALLMSARLVSVFCNTGTVIVCFKIADRLFSGLYRWMFVIFVAFLPQFIYIGSYVNNDAMAIFSTALIVYAWIHGLTSHWSRLSCFELAASISVCALSYYNAYGFILCSILLYFADRLITYREVFNPDYKSGRQQFWSQTGRQVGLITAIVFILAGWWFIRNAILYQGDFLGLRTSDHCAQINALEAFKPSHIDSAYNNHWNIWYLLFDKQWLVISYISLIGCFGYMEIWLKPVIYYGYTILWAISGIGLFSWIINGITGHTLKLDFKKNLLFVVLFITIPIPFLLSLYYSYYGDFQPQGRYLLPMLIPLMIFITKGFQLVIDKGFVKIWIRRCIQVMLCLLCAAAAFYCYFYILIPHYHP